MSSFGGESSSSSVPPFSILSFDRDFFQLFFILDLSTGSALSS